MLTRRHADLLEARGLDVELLERLGVSSERKLGEDTISIPYQRGERTVGVKYRTISGEKRFLQEPGSEQILYNRDCLSDPTIAHMPIIVTEGEVDCWAALQAGFPRSVSVPGGAPAVQVGDRAAAKYAFVDDMPESTRGATIILAVDSDDPGAALRADLALRFGAQRCQWVRYPQGCKDLADALAKYGVKGVVETINRAQWMVGNVYRMADIPPVAPALPHDSGFPGLRDHYRLRLGDFCVVTGVPGMGKTAFVNDLVCRMVTAHNWPACFASFEQVPTLDHRRALRTWYGGAPVKDLDEETIANADCWINEHFAFVVPDDESYATVPWVLDRFEAAALRYGTRLFVLDPWNELEHDRAPGVSLTEHVGTSIRDMKAFARKYEAHLIVVAHPAKLRRDQDGKYPVPSLYDISDCYSADTEVLTERGWLLHRDVTMADRVACFDLDTSNITWESPSEIVRYEHSGMMAHFKGPSMDMLVTPNHRMVVKPAWENPVGANNGIGRPERWAKKQWQFCPARDLPANPFHVPLAATLHEGEEPESIELDGGYPTIPFLRFMGWWLAEGWVASNSISICQQPGDLQREIAATMQSDLGLSITQATDGYPDRPHCKPTWRAYVKKRSSPQIVEWLIANCGEGAANKRIPDMVWHLSPRLKRVLLEAYIDGDGFRPLNRGGSSATTTSPFLRDGFQRLAVECGIPCCVGEKRQSKPHHSPSWQLNFGRPERRTLTFRTARHLKWVPYTGDVWCLRVPTGAYVTRRNGRVAFQGNSAHWSNKADVGIIVHRKTEDETVIKIAKSRYHDQIGKPGEVSVRFVWQRATYQEFTA